MERFFQWMSACVLAIVLCGCNAPRDRLATFNRQLEAGRIDQAAGFAHSHIKNEDRPSPGRDDLLWTLQLATVERMRGDYAKSTDAFDRAEVMLQHYATDPQMASAIAAAVINDNATPYTGSIYDGIMVNTYKALNFMKIGDIGLARVEINRALERQRRAAEDFAARIEAVKDELDDSSHSPIAHRSMENAELRQKLSETYTSLDDFAPYPDFINPFTTYLAGVFFAAVGDYQRASDQFRQAVGMLPDNTPAVRDLAEVEQALNTGTALNPTVWVIFENGLGPVKEEVRLDLPLFIVTDRVRYVGVALPQLVFRPAAAGTLDIYADGQGQTTAWIVDMDRIVQTEFKAAFDGIVLRAILSAAAKATAQYMLERNDQTTMAILTALYSYATTAADVRIWSSLPKNFQAARLPRPADGRLTLAAGHHPPITVALDSGRHTLVYVKMVSANTPPQIEVINF